MADNALKNYEINSSEIEKMKVELASAKEIIHTLQVACTTMKDRIVQLGSYYIPIVRETDNLLFTNIKDAKDENCEQNVGSLLESNLEMDKERVDQIKILCCHKLGVQNPKSTI